MGIYDKRELFEPLKEADLKGLNSRSVRKLLTEEQPGLNTKHDIEISFLNDKGRTYSRCTREPCFGIMVDMISTREDDLEYADDGRDDDDGVPSWRYVKYQPATIRQRWLTVAERYAWIKLGLQLNCLPKKLILLPGLEKLTSKHKSLAAQTRAVFQHGIIIDVEDQRWSRELAYIALCWLRMLPAYPEIVRLTLQLTERGREPLAAMLAAHWITRNNDNEHAFVPWSALNPRVLANLREFLKNPYGDSKNNLLSHNYRYSYFGGQDLLDKNTHGIPATSVGILLSDKLDKMPKGKKQQGVLVRKLNAAAEVKNQDRFAGFRDYESDYGDDEDDDYDYGYY